MLQNRFRRSKWDCWSRRWRISRPLTMISWVCLQSNIYLFDNTSICTVRVTPSRNNGTFERANAERTCADYRRGSHSSQGCGWAGLFTPSSACKFGALHSMSPMFLFLQESTKILDKYTLWEMGDNEWLKSEVQFVQPEGAELSTFLVRKSKQHCRRTWRAGADAHWARAGAARRGDEGRADEPDSPCEPLPVHHWGPPSQQVCTVQCSVFINRHHPAEGPSSIIAGLEDAKCEHEA